jgi:hypothetical protein
MLADRPGRGVNIEPVAGMEDRGGVFEPGAATAHAQA